MLKWTFLIAFSPDGQVICYSEDAEYDPFGFGDYDESDNDNVDCTNGFEGLVSTARPWATQFLVPQKYPCTYREREATLHENSKIVAKSEKINNTWHEHPSKILVD